jgi:hypothetical protein
MRYFLAIITYNDGEKEPRLVQAESKEEAEEKVLKEYAWGVRVEVKETLI